MLINKKDISEGASLASTTNKTIKTDSKNNMLTAKQLCEMYFPLNDDFIENLIPRGITILAGAPKTGKSFMALYMAICIAKGISYMNRPVQQASVLYFSFEDMLKVTKKRLQMFIEDNDVPENLYITQAAPSNTDEFLKELEDIIEKNPDIKLVVLDTLSYIRGSDDIKSNAYTTDNVFMSKLNKFKKEKEISFLLVHHTNRRENIVNAQDSISGSNGLTGGADALIVLRRLDENSTDVMLTACGRSIPHMNTRISMDKNGKWQMSEDGYVSIEEAEYNNDNIVIAVRELLKEKLYWKGSVSEISKEIEQITGIPCIISNKTLSTQLRKRLKELFFKYDNIRYEYYSNNGSGGTHYFSKVKDNILENADNMSKNNEIDKDIL